MQLLQRLATAILTASLCIQKSAAVAPTTYVHPETRIKFGTWSFGGGETTQGAYTFGIALPEGSLRWNASEYIGLLQGTITNSSLTGWAGLSHGGHMTDSLLLVAYPYKGKVETSFRYTTAHEMPALYTGGKASLTQIASSVNATSFEVIYRCEGCFAWHEGNVTASAGTATGTLLLGHAQAKAGPSDAECPTNITFGFHDNGFGTWNASLQGVESPFYYEWTRLATKRTEGHCGAVVDIPPPRFPWPWI